MTLRTRVAALAIFVLAAPQPALAQATGQDAGTRREQKPTDSRDTAPVRLRFEGYPSLRAGRWLRLDVHAKVQADARHFEASPALDGEPFKMPRRRLGIEGRIGPVVAFEVERELDDSRHPWRDVFVDVQPDRGLRVRAGQFKVPFGHEQLTSASRLDFVYRTLATSTIAPGRDVGAMVGGRFFDRGLTYAAGWFRADGDNARAGLAAGAERTWAARLTARPFQALPVPGLQRLEVGAAAARSDLPAGLSGLGVRSVTGFETFAPMYVAGDRRRLAAEARWVAGPVALSTEWLEARDDRLGQGIGDRDLPDLVARGWYVGGTWLVTGEAKREDLVPHHELFRGGGGALELALRTEGLGFRSADRSGPAFRNPRAANVLSNDLRRLTAGINWYANRFVRLQVNFVREEVEDPARRPDATRPTAWHTVVRLQFAM